MSAYPFRSEAAKARYLAHYDERAKAWPVPSTTRLVEGAFGQTFVRSSGTEDAPPLLLLPGIGSPGLTFSQNVADLSTRFRVHAVDNIHDHGRSMERAEHPVKDLADFVTWLDELCDGLGVGAQVNVAGLSFGGCLAGNYALARPERVRRLVLLAPAGLLAPISWAFIWRAVLCLIPARVFMRNFMKWVSPELREGGPHAARLAEMADDGFLAQRCFASRRMVPPLPFSDEEWKRLTVPTLLLAGDREVIFPPEASFARVKALVPSMEQALLPGAGHDFFVTRAPEVNRRVLEFLGG